MRPSMRGGLLTVANCITISRLLLTPVFVYFFVIGDKHAALVVFCVASGTDLIDGMVARLLKQRSRHGAILDPMADKALLESAFLCLVVVGVLPLWFLILALTRDILIVAAIIFFAVKKVKIPFRAIWSSKFATLFQLATVVTALLLWWKPGIMLMGLPFHQVVYALMVAAAILIFISGVLYFRLGFGLLKSYRSSSQ